MKDKQKDFTDKCQNCGSKRIVLVEYDYENPEHYDGISEIYCLKCKARFGRWSGKRLKRGEFEPIYGIERKEEH